MDNSSGPSKVLDKVAVAFSGLCLVHCLALPLLIVILPFSGQFSDGHLHMKMLILVVPVSVVALALGFQRHRHPGVVIAGVAGMIIITVGSTIAHNYYGLFTDRLLTIVGSLVLAYTHYRNSRLTRHVAN